MKNLGFSWIEYFLSKRENKFFCKIDQAFINDNFNLYGLNKQVSYYEQSLDLICDINDEHDYSENHEELIKKDAVILFGLLHARYILTTQGMQTMLEKYRNQDFGKCINVGCLDVPLLPCGISDKKNVDNVKLFCPSCEKTFDVRDRKEKSIDGAYFGKSFPHLFFINFPEMKTNMKLKQDIPTIFGFKVHKDGYVQSFEQKKKLCIQMEH